MARGLSNNPAFQQIPQIGKLPLLQMALENFAEAMRVGDDEQAQRIMTDIEGKLTFYLRNPKNGEYYYWDTFTNDKNEKQPAVIKQLKALAEQTADEELKVPLELRTPEGRQRFLSSDNERQKYQKTAGLYFADFRHRYINDVIDKNGLLGSEKDAVSME